MQVISKKISVKIIIACFMLAYFVLGFSSVSLAENSAGGKAALDGLDQSAKKAYTGNSAGNLDNSGVITDIPTAIGQIVGAILSFIGIIFLVLIIYSGFLWMTARGNEQQVTKAKDMIGAAIVGLVIVLAAYAITAYIGGLLTSSNS